jgi:hypothetical protein
MAVGLVLLFVLWRSNDSSPVPAPIEVVDEHIRQNAIMCIAALACIVLGAIAYIVFSIRARRSAEPPTENAWK